MIILHVLSFWFGLASKLVSRCGQVQSFAEL